LIDAMLIAPYGPGMLSDSTPRLDEATAQRVVEPLLPTFAVAKVVPRTGGRLSTVFEVRAFDIRAVIVKVYAERRRHRGRIHSQWRHGSSARCCSKPEMGGLELGKQEERPVRRLFCFGSRHLAATALTNIIDNSLLRYLSGASGGLFILRRRPQTAC
jgi:hypothetical protein